MPFCPGPVVSLRRTLAVILLLCGTAAAQPAPTADELFARGIQLFQGSDIIGAIEAYEAALQKAPDRPDIRSNLGAAFARLGRYDEAIDHYRGALVQAPGQVAIRFNLALALYKAARIPEAKTELEAVVAGDGNNRNAVLLLADCLSQMGDDGAVAALLRPREEQFEDDRLFAYLLGNALIRRNELMRGQVYIDRLFRDGDTAEARILMGAAHLGRGDAKGAVAELETAVSLNSALPTVHSILGRALLQAGRRDDAAAAFRRELQQNPNDFWSNLYLGLLLKDDSKLDESYEHIMRAGRLRSGDPAVSYGLGALHLAADRLEAAQQALESVTEQVPNYSQAHVLLATVYYRQKKKALGDRHRDIARKLAAEQQALEPGARADPVPGYTGPGGGRGGADDRPSVWKDRTREGG